MALKKKIFCEKNERFLLVKLLFPSLWSLDPDAESGSMDPIESGATPLN